VGDVEAGVADVGAELGDEVEAAGVFGVGSSSGQWVPRLPSARASMTAWQRTSPSEWGVEALASRAVALVLRSRLHAFRGREPGPRRCVLSDVSWVGLLPRQSGVGLPTAWWGSRHGGCRRRAGTFPRRAAPSLCRCTSTMSGVTTERPGPARCGTPLRSMSPSTTYAVSRVDSSRVSTSRHSAVVRLDQLRSCPRSHSAGADTPGSACSTSLFPSRGALSGHRLGPRRRQVTRVVYLVAVTMAAWHGSTA
jgi:hypothetical protein